MEEVTNFQIFFALLIYGLGTTLSSIVVAKYIYLPWVNKLKEDKEEDYKMPYEEMLPFQEIYNCDVDLDCVSKNRYITDETPEGYVFMRYNKEEEGFEYWCDNKNIRFMYLETVARKYVSNYLCKSLYKDRKTEEDKQENNEKQEKEEEEEMDDVFVKPKKSTEKSKSRSISNTVSNKYIYKGKISDMEVFKKKKKTNKDKKKKMSFADYKRLFTSSAC